MSGSIIDGPSPPMWGMWIVIGEPDVISTDLHQLSVNGPAFDLPTTLSYLSMKAGLPADGWKEGATFAVFEATVFGEKERH